MCHVYLACMRVFLYPNKMYMHLQLCMKNKKKKTLSGNTKCKQMKQMYRYVREACDFTTNPHPLKGFASKRT